MHILRTEVETQSKPAPWQWHAQLPIQHCNILWWEVLSCHKVRAADESDGVYLATYERGGLRDTLVTLYKADGGDFGVVWKQRVDVDPDDWQPLRGALLLAVDELLHSVTVVYLRYRPTVERAGVAALALLMRRFGLSSRPTDKAGSVFRATDIGVPVGVRRSAMFRLNDVLLLADGELLLCGRFKEAGGDEHAALYQLQTRGPNELHVAPVDSLLQTERLPFLSHFAYKSSCIVDADFEQGKQRLFMSLPSPSVRAPVVLSAADVNACTLFQYDTVRPGRQPALNMILARQHAAAESVRLLGEWRGWLVVWSVSDGRVVLRAIRGWNAAKPRVLAVRTVNVSSLVPAWASAHLGNDSLPTTTLSLRGAELLVQLSVRSVTPRVFVARVRLDQWLPSAPLCFGCRITQPPTAPDKILACVVCKAKGFSRYGWLFGSHYCSRACQVANWKAHKPVHQLPPIDVWSNRDWSEWQRLVKHQPPTY